MDQKHFDDNENYCTYCGVAMGPMNPRQLCRKTYCPLMDDVDFIPYYDRQNTIENEKNNTIDKE